MAGPDSVRRNLSGPDAEDRRGVLGTYRAAYHARHHQGLSHADRLSLPHQQVAPGRYARCPRRTATFQLRAV